MHFRLLFLLTLALFLGACAVATPPPPPPPTETPSAGGTETTPPPSTPIPTPSVAEPERTLYTVRRGEIVNELTLEGRVVQVQQGQAFTEDGVLKAIFVQVGDMVEQGQLLAELDTRDLNAQLSQARAVYEQDRIALERARGNAQTQVRQAQVDLDGARSELARARRGARPDEISRARAVVQQAAADLANVRNEASQVKNQALREMETAVERLTFVQERFAETQIEFEKNPNEATRNAFIQAREDLRVAEDEVRRTRIAYDTALSNEVALVSRAEAVVAATQADLDRLLAGPDPFDVAQAEQAVARAQIALEAARQQAQTDPELAKQIARSQAEVTRLEQQIESRRLIATMAGQVVALEAEPGIAVRAASPVIMLANNDRREIIVEEPVGLDPLGTTTRLLPGQEVAVEFVRYPGQIFPGVVTRVPGRLPTSDAFLSSEYAISYEAPGVELSVGDIAEVTIVLGRVANALWLPPEAVIVTRDRSFVNKVDGDTEQRLEIVTGIVTPNQVEILRGLVEGDVVAGEVLPR
ncbi:biotin/lipoyl-binding protein [Candidatus Chloroploca sp. M-50]|uniref:Biotin/lipoyl-binding protein n=1 Tax=Candidatus Chloroploca mongolica TaxID=2528176 RepID=A0ABS4DBR4_9CHLR|nr:biotin/lipoyl-binding protein [Candidatus Chloroploca mongolica]MBP1466888.1 biotin/lipoyl-binding protein [Candidatus Chloroploca mongolica]